MRKSAKIVVNVLAKRHLFMKDNNVGDVKISIFQMCKWYTHDAKSKQDSKKLKESYRKKK